MHKYTAVILTLFSFIFTNAFADNNAPWGRGKLTPTEYKPQKVVYDVTTGELEIMDHVLDRASYLSTITGADPFEQSIVLVLHGSAIKFFAIENTGKFKQLLVRAESLVSGEVLKIKMCKLAAQAKGFKPEDIHGFVGLVPMGDAEIIRLQYEEGHAYMQ
jgi:intracellular sulfur oxidation DsrE/DsrF family protein